MLWDQTIVQAYDLSRLLAQIAPISGEVVAHEIQCRIYPESWSDPGALVFYHAPTRKLLVMHGPDAQRRVLGFSGTIWASAASGRWDRWKRSSTVQRIIEKRKTSDAEPK